MSRLEQKAKLCYNIINRQGEMQIIKSDRFNKWYKKLDMTQRTLVDIRLTRILVDNHFGTVRNLGEIFELKFSSGLRVYYGIRETQIVLLLNGGNKNTKRQQSNDIRLAKEIFKEFCDGESI